MKIAASIAFPSKGDINIETPKGLEECEKLTEELNKAIYYAVKEVLEERNMKPLVTVSLSAGDIDRRIFAVKGDAEIKLKHGNKWKKLTQDHEVRSPEEPLLKGFERR